MLLAAAVPRYRAAGRQQEQTALSLKGDSFPAGRDVKQLREGLAPKLAETGGQWVRRANPRAAL